MSPLPAPPTIPLPPGDALPLLCTEVPGPRSLALLDALAEAECPSLTARRRRRAELSGADQDPIVWAAARGANVVDADGNRYVDLTAGFGAALVGHGHPDVVRAVQRQAAVLLHALGDVYPSDTKIALETQLCALAPWPARVILGLSGSDAVEAALKSCVLATGRSGVLAFEGGYHGLSHGPLAACGYKAAFREPFAAQLGQHVAFAPYPAGDALALQKSLTTCASILRRGEVDAVLLEPILGRGGVFEGELDALGELVAIAHEAGALVIADEIYTGLGRTGAGWFDSARWRLAPDVICLGKALGGGVPVSACLLRESVALAWGAPGGEALHTSTFLGNPPSCAAALATLEVLGRDETRADFARASTQLEEHLSRLSRDPALGVEAPGGRGLLRGVRLEGGLVRALRVVRALLERGYLALPGGVAGDWLTLTPPGCITDAQLQGFARALEQALRA